VKNPSHRQKTGPHRNRRRRHVKGGSETIRLEIDENSHVNEGVAEKGFDNKKPAICIAGSQVEVEFLSFGHRTVGTPFGDRLPILQDAEHSA
jgi:hypothetical protein